MAWKLEYWKLWESEIATDTRSRKLSCMTLRAEIFQDCKHEYSKPRKFFIETLCRIWLTLKTCLYPSFRTLLSVQKALRSIDIFPLLPKNDPTHLTKKGWETAQWNFNSCFQKCCFFTSGHLFYSFDKIIIQIRIQIQNYVTRLSCFQGKVSQHVILQRQLTWLLDWIA